LKTWQAFCNRVEPGIARARRVSEACERRDLQFGLRNGGYSGFLFSGERLSLSTFNAYRHLDSPDLLTWR